MSHKRTVILSGVGASLREAPTESKDPVPAEREMNSARSSHDVTARDVKTPVLGLRGMGSFDCGAVRFTGGTFAQDDRVLFRTRGERTVAANAKDQDWGKAKWTFR